MSSCRNDLQPVSWPPATDVQGRPVTHAGLWLDKYIANQSRADKTARAKLVEQVASLREPDVYASFYRRWQQALRDMNPDNHSANQLRMAVATVMGRMVVGLGEESVLETAITLHRTYGVPYIRGSALKGLAASFARQRLGEQWSMPTEQALAAQRKAGEKKRPPYTIVFGNTHEAGYVTFLDALYVPGSGVQGRPLHADVLTVHHEGYYQDKQESPADWDNPNPVPFLSATGQYLVALVGPAKWVDVAWHVLRLALLGAGVGAKTSSGYGRVWLPAVDGEPMLYPPAGQRGQPASQQGRQAVRGEQTEHPGQTGKPKEGGATSGGALGTGGQPGVQPPAQARVPEVGERFRARIVEVDERRSRVALELPDTFQDAAGATIALTPVLRKQIVVVLPPEHKTGGGWKKGNTRWVEVVQVREEKGRTVLEVKPSAAVKAE